MATNFANGIGELIERLKSSVTGVFQKKSASVLGVDIGSSAIKVVQLRKQAGKAVLETYGELALGPYADQSVGQAVKLSDEKIVEALGDVMREANVTTTDAGMAIPLSSSLVSVVEMPRVSEARLKEMVPIEARRYIPVPISEVALDWSVVPEVGMAPGARPKQADETAPGTRGKVRVLIAAIHNEVINRYQNIAQQMGITLNFLEIEVFSFARSLLGRQRGTTLILDIGAATAKLSIIENGIAVSTHIINHGSQDVTRAIAQSIGATTVKAEEHKREHGLTKPAVPNGEEDAGRLVIDGIFSETQKAIAQFERMYRKTVDMVVLSGGGSLLKGIMPIAKKSFDTEVVYANPFTKVEAPAFIGEVLEQIGPNFAVAVGVALRKLQEIE